MKNARIHVVTLGVGDVQRSRQFYEKLGFTASSSSNEYFVAFQTPGIVFCLYPMNLLAEDATVDAQGTGFRGVTLSALFTFTGRISVGCEAPI